MCVIMYRTHVQYHGASWWGRAYGDVDANNRSIVLSPRHQYPGNLAVAGRLGQACNRHSSGGRVMVQQALIVPYLGSIVTSQPARSWRHALHFVEHKHRPALAIPPPPPVLLHLSLIIRQCVQHVPKLLLYMCDSHKGRRRRVPGHIPVITSVRDCRIKRVCYGPCPGTSRHKVAKAILSICYLVCPQWYCDEAVSITNRLRR